LIHFDIKNETRYEVESKLSKELTKSFFSLKHGKCFEYCSEYNSKLEKTHTDNSKATPPKIHLAGFSFVFKLNAQT